MIDAAAGQIGSRRARRRWPLAAFLVRRVAAALATLFVVSILIFAGTEVLPGDAAGPSWDGRPRPTSSPRCRR